MLPFHKPKRTERLIIRKAFFSLFIFLISFHIRIEWKRPEQHRCIGIIVAIHWRFFFYCFIVQNTLWHTLSRRNALTTWEFPEYFATFCAFSLQLQQIVTLWMKNGSRNERNLFFFSPRQFRCMQMKRHGNDVLLLNDAYLFKIIWLTVIAEALSSKCI